MEICFWGTRGSIPKPITQPAIDEKLNQALQLIKNGRDLEKLPFHVRGTYGGNTACVEFRQDDEFMIFDAGTGLRELGNHVIANSGGKKSGQVFNIFLSHPHWDHIQGFPFFVPAFIPGNRINIYGFHPNLEQVFTQQQSSPFFPVPLSSMPAEIHFYQLKTGQEYDIGGCRIKGIKQNHPGDSYGYSFEKNNKKIIYSSDYEHGDLSLEKPFIEFCKNADLVIMDAQYSFADANYFKENWGHSSNIIVTELAVTAKAKRLCLFHHDPNCSDKDLDNILSATKDYLAYYDANAGLMINMAYDGLVLKI